MLSGIAEKYESTRGSGVQIEAGVDPDCRNSPLCQDSQNEVRRHVLRIGQHEHRPICVGHQSELWSWS
ncbi:hypothetical protein SAMN05216371_3665 [Streptomyces sp. TLI_053]|nr:hypothetical protein SAMN05216371_3665 [Streptomyces sp. TLI_053]